MAGPTSGTTVADWAFNDKHGAVVRQRVQSTRTSYMLDLVAKLWGRPHAYNSSIPTALSTEVLVACGVPGGGCLYILLWRGFQALPELLSAW